MTPMRYFSKINYGQHSLNSVTNLKRIVFGKGVTSFNNIFGTGTCQTDYMQLPTTLRSIAYGIVARSPLVLVCLAVTPPTSTSANSLFTTNRLQGLYVPDASVDAYKVANKWKNYAAKIKPLSEYTGRVYYEAD